jgi:alkanesulfonate monooxygenase SsuD/methylene tetrahydromethanopterin reductase-like flavin-dependent oxidoreductase (luciferase family)
VTAQPDDAPLPPVWLLGSSDYSANLAAQIGHGFAFAAHFSPASPEVPMLQYRERFKAGALARPHAILALVAFARLRTGRPAKLLNAAEARIYEFTPGERAAVENIRAAQIIGTPATVKARIDELVAATQADEVMVTTFAAEHGRRLQSYELVAKAFGLQAG